MLNSHATAPGQLLSGQITGFTRFARQNRFNIGIQETLDSHRLAESIDITNKKQLKLGLKSLICTSVSDWDRFDAVFDRYWQPIRERQNAQTTIGGKSSRQASLAEMIRSGSGGNFDIPEGNSLDNIGASDSNMSHGGASATELEQKKDFSQLNNPAELRHLEDIAERLARRIRQRLLRRQRIHRHGNQIDMRRSFRASLRYGGLPLDLKLRKRRRQLPKLVILLDVSRSMSVYSYLFLRFARGILSAFKGSDAFAFHTRLIHIGETLRDASQRKLDEKMSLISTGWDGGTRIDQSLKMFNRDYARNLLGSRSIVIIVSDGYDTGEPQALVEQLKRIKSRARKLLWLNPLLGLENYAPITQCMQAALPLIDVFAPAHNLESLAALEDHLSGV